MPRQIRSRRLAMAALANPFLDSVRTDESGDAASAPRHPLAQLAAMHAEAVETARLANLLGHSRRLVIAIPVLAALAVILGGNGLAPTSAWVLLFGISAVAIHRSYAHPVQ